MGRAGWTSREGWAKLTEDEQLLLEALPEEAEAGLHGGAQPDPEDEGEETN